MVDWFPKEEPLWLADLSFESTDIEPVLEARLWISSSSSSDEVWEANLGEADLVIAAELSGSGSVGASMIGRRLYSIWHIPDLGEDGT